MKLKVIFLLAVVALPSLTGCHFFKRSKKPKENPAIASDVEATFQQRWIERRAAQLTAAGTEAAQARQTAENEFRENYPYLVQPKK